MTRTAGKLVTTYVNLEVLEGIFEQIRQGWFRVNKPPNNTPQQKQVNIKNPCLEKFGQGFGFIAPIVADCLTANPPYRVGESAAAERSGVGAQGVHEEFPRTEERVLHER